MAAPRAQIEITASSGKLKTALDMARGKLISFGSFAGKTFSAINNKFKLGKTAQHAAGEMAGNIGQRGLDALVGTATGVRDFERNLTRFGIAANATPEKINAMRSSVRALSKETAINSDEILAAAQNYFDLTGDAEGTTAAMRSFARIAQASGSNMGDVSTAAAAMQDSLKLSPAEFEATFSGLIAQGKAGSVSLKDFASELTSLAPKFARFKGAMGRDGALQLGAAFQVARKGFGSASEAATGLEALMGALVQNASKFKGVKIFNKNADGSKTMRNLHDVIVDIGKSKLAKDPTLLGKAFGSKEAEAAFNQLNRLPDVYNQMVAAGQDVQTVNRDLTTYLESDSGKIDAAFNRVKETIAGVFTPERITAFANAVSALADKLGPVVDSVGKIGDYMGAMYGAGQSVRGFLTGNNARDYNMGDFALAQTGLQMGGDNSPQARNMRMAGAASRIKDVDAFNATAKTIMGKERDEKTTDQSLQQAYMLEHFPTMAWGQGRSGQVEAAGTYIEKAGVSEADVAKKIVADNAALQALFALTKSVQEQTAAMLNGVNGVTVQIGADPVAKASANAPIQSARPGGRNG